MRLIVNTKLLLPVVLLSALALAACDNKPEAPAASTETSAPATTPAEPAAAAPAAEAPAATAPAITPESAMQAVQQQVGSMTDEQKQQTIADARKAAEDAAKAQNMTDEQVKQAGDLAEQAAKQTLGVQ